jgi:hypothetical protein
MSAKRNLVCAIKKERQKIYVSERTKLFVLFLPSAGIELRPLWYVTLGFDRIDTGSAVQPLRTSGMSSQTI